MLLQEPGHSPYDIRFEFLGFPVRVSWSFWLASVVFGYRFAQGLEDRFGLDSPGLIPLLMLWAACVFVSILIHELGHALAFRRSRIDSSIVLYFLGGLAIPRTAMGTGRGPLALSPQQSIWIAAAGPLAQILSAVLVIVAVRMSGYQAPLPWPLSEFTWLRGGEDIDSVGLFAIVTMYVYPSVLWAILNLIPVWPLDGGRIMTSFVQLNGGSLVQSLWVSVIAAALMAGYGFSNGDTYLAVLFMILGVNNFQVIQQINGARF
jgi:Zn-dependent protease